MKDKLREQATMILDNFDFKEVEKVMEFINWPLRPNKNLPSFTPDDAYLKNLASECLNMAIDDDRESATVEYGPFEALKQDGLMELKFVVQKYNPLGDFLNPDTKNELGRKS